MRIAAIALLTGFALCPYSLAEPEEGALESDVFPLPAGSFVANVKGRVADVAAVLRKYGFDLPDGSEAIYQVPRRLLYLKSTRKDINRLTRALEDRLADSGEFDRRQIRITATSYAYLIAPDDIVAMERFEPSPDGLAELPKDRLRIVSRQSITTRSGQRAKVSDRRGAEDEDAKEDGERSTAPVAIFEVDPVIGYDGDVVDLNLAFELAQPVKGEDRARYGQVSTAISIAPGQSMVFEVGYLDVPEPHLLILKVGIELLGKDGKIRTGSPERVRFPEDYFDRVR